MKQKLVIFLIFQLTVGAALSFGLYSKSQPVGDYQFPDAFRFSGGIISPRSSAAGFRIPSLANKSCLGTDSDGDFQTGSGCGGGGISSLNGLTGATQTFTTSTGSNSFNITSGGTAHDIKIPSNLGFFTNDVGYVTSTGVSTNTGNWVGTWQGVNSSTFYLASNPSGYIATSTGLTTGNFATTSISQWVNDVGYVTSTGAGAVGTTTAVTANYFPFWGSATGLSGTSTLFASSTRIGLGTVSPSTTLHVVGDLKVTATSTISGALLDSASNRYVTSTEYFMLKTFAALGSSIKAQSVGISAPNLASSLTIADGTFYFVPVYLPVASTLTGIKWLQTVTGSVTTDQNNNLGLYTYSGGTLTLVASTTNSAGTWQQPVGIASSSFNTAYSASEGLYFVGALGNWSAATTTPSIAATASITATSTLFYDFSNSAKLWGTLTGQNSLPTSTTMSALSNGTLSLRWFALY